MNFFSRSKQEKEAAKGRDRRPTCDESITFGQERAKQYEASDASTWKKEGWLPTIGTRAAEGVRSALDLLEADERAMCAEGLWRESGSIASVTSLHDDLMKSPEKLSVAIRKAIDGDDAHSVTGAVGLRAELRTLQGHFKLNDLEAAAVVRASGDLDERRWLVQNSVETTSFARAREVARAREREPFFFGRTEPSPSPSRNAPGQAGPAVSPAPGDVHALRENAQGVSTEERLRTVRRRARAARRSPRTRVGQGHKRVLQCHFNSSF